MYTRKKKRGPSRVRDVFYQVLFEVSFIPRGGKDATLSRAERARAGTNRLLPDSISPIVIFLLEKLLVLVQMRNAESSDLVDPRTRFELRRCINNFIGHTENIFIYPLSLSLSPFAKLSICRVDPASIFE